MGFLDKAKAAAEQAAAKAKEGVDEVQSKRNLTHAYESLGRVAFELIESGDIANARLDAAAQEVRDLHVKGDAEPVGVAGNGAEAPPPAMPT
jgi:outer membrane murein-binding lipoprotein Lpp